MNCPECKQETEPEDFREVGVCYECDYLPDNDTCQACHALIEGGNPFSKYCDTCLDACDCGDCSDTPIEQRPRKID